MIKNNLYWCRNTFRSLFWFLLAIVTGSREVRSLIILAIQRDFTYLRLLTPHRIPSVITTQYSNCKTPFAPLSMEACHIKRTSQIDTLIYPSTIYLIKLKHLTITNALRASWKCTLSANGCLTIDVVSFSSSAWLVFVHIDSSSELCITASSCNDVQVL